MLAVAPREQVLIIRFEEFTADTAATYERTLAFLGLPSDGRVSFPRHNQGKMYRYPKVIDFLRNPPPVFNTAMFAGKRVLNAFGIHPIALLRSRMTVERERTELDPAFRGELIEEFADDVSRLERLLGADLREWRR